MAENYSAQNSITIKRLRSNDSLMLTFENNGIPLFQAVDEESGAVSLTHGSSHIALNVS